MDVDYFIAQFVGVLSEGVYLIAHGVYDLLKVGHFLLPVQRLGLQLLQLPVVVLHLVQGLIVGREVAEEDQHDENQHHLHLILFLAFNLHLHLLQPLLNHQQVFFRPRIPLLPLRHVSVALDDLHRTPLLIIRLRLHTLCLHDYIQILKTIIPSHNITTHRTKNLLEIALPDIEMCVQGPLQISPAMASVNSMEQFQAAESLEQVMLPPPIYESSQHTSRSMNLYDLIKLHRNRQKYEIVDRFFNAYLQIQNKLQPIQAYYHYESFKFYLEDLSLVYFKDIELYQNVRIAFLLRRLNFTLNGQEFTLDFKQYLQENRCYDQLANLFSKQYLEQLSNQGNKSSVLDLRNTLSLCFIIDTMYTYGFTNEQIKETVNKIHRTYSSILEKINNPNDADSILDQSQQNYLHDLSESMQQPCSMTPQPKEVPYNYAERYSFWFEDMIYQEEIDLKIIETQLEIQYFSNLISQSEQPSKREEYLIQIDKQIVEKLKDLRDVNLRNRELVKKINRNIKIELMTGIKCICISDSSNYLHCFGEPLEIDTVRQQKCLKLQRVMDIEYMQNQLLKMITKLKMRLIADAIEKVFEIHKDNRGEMLFSVTFEHGLGIKQAVFCQSDFLRLNEIREESTLTSYLTPMKSTYSYISHNIYTFLKLVQKDFPYSKESNNNQQVMKSIRNKLSKSKYFGRTDLKQLYQEEFKLCHNCKILCHQDFFKQCKKRVKQNKEEQSQGSDDSLYTQKNFRRKSMTPQFKECEKYYCLYCIKNQFNGKIFNDKGWCPACLNNCHCNTCLRDKILKKYVELYLYIGGDKETIKSEKDMVDEMRVKDEEERNEEEEESLNGTEVEEKVYESVIKKEIMKGYSADQIGLSLRQQEELLELILRRESVKLKNLEIEKLLFRQKIGFVSNEFDYQQIDVQNQAEKARIQHQKQLQREQALQRQKKKREKKLLQKGSDKRKCRKVRRQQQVYYDFYRYDDDDSDFQSSSFHLKHRKVKERNYQPQFYF